MGLFSFSSTSNVKAQGIEKKVNSRLYSKGH